MRATRSDGPPARCEHQLGWVLQRLAWAGGLVILLAAAAGYLGGEPSSRRVAVSADGLLRVEYDRYGRSGRPCCFLVQLEQVRPGSAITLDFLIDTPGLLIIHDITPAPVRSESLPGGVRLHFAVAGAASTIGIRCDAPVWGVARCTIAASAGASSSTAGLRQIIYP